MTMAKQTNKLTKGYLTDVMNGIIQNIALPILTEKGFVPSPFTENWYGKDNLHSYTYDLFRLSGRSELEYLSIYVNRGNMEIDLHINVFLPSPPIDSMEALNGLSIFPFILPPNSKSLLRLGSEEFGKIPLFRMFREEDLRMGVPRNQTALSRRTEKLSSTIGKMCTRMDDSFVRWHERHRLRAVDWKGVPIAS
jgi:hypothetical protein